METIKEKEEQPLLLPPLPPLLPTKAEEGEGEEEANNKNSSSNNNNNNKDKDVLLSKQHDEELYNRILANLSSLGITSNTTSSSNSTSTSITTSSTESIGHRNVVHRRVQSTTLFSILDPPSISSSTNRHRVRSLSLAEAFPSLDKYYPGSHLLDHGHRSLVDTPPSSSSGQLPYYFCSLWLLPPLPLRKQLSKEIAQRAMKYAVPAGSSAPFMPHVTIIGSIACGSLREATQLGEQFKAGLQLFTEGGGGGGGGGVPCRFDPNRSCLAMYHDDNDDDEEEEEAEEDGDEDGDEKEEKDDSSTKAIRAGAQKKKTRRRRRRKKQQQQSSLVWSQSCIAVMERSEEYMKVLETARKILKLPPGEWMFPGPICEPHYSHFYGSKNPMTVHDDHDDHDDDDDYTTTTSSSKNGTIPPPPDFVATEASLFLTTPGTLSGVAKWREITRIPLTTASSTTAAAAAAVSTTSASISTSTTASTTASTSTSTSTTTTRTTTTITAAT